MLYCVPEKTVVICNHVTFETRLDGECLSVTNARKWHTPVLIGDHTPHSDQTRRPVVLLKVADWKLTEALA